MTMIKQLAYIFNRKEKCKIAALFVAAVIGSMLECLGTGMFMPFVEILMDTSRIQSTPYLRFFYQTFSFRSETNFLVAMTVTIIVIFVVKNLYLIIEKYVIYCFSYGTQRKISTRLLQAYMSEPYTFHLNKNISVLQRSMQEDVNLFTNAIIHFMELIIEVTVCIALGIYLFDVSHSITVIVVGLLIVCVGCCTAISRKFARNLGKDSQGYKAKIYQWMNQALGGIKEIKVLNRENYFVEEYDSYYKKYAKGLRISRLIGVLPKYLIEMVSISGFLLAVIIKMKYGQREFMDFIPQLAAFAVAAFRLLPSVGRLNEHVTNILYASPSIELVYNDLKEIQDMQHDYDKVVECEEKHHDKDSNESRADWRFQDKIDIYDVCYQYPDTEKYVIDKARFSIKKGQTIAFIGESGAGKTTMADIILGLLIPQYGKIKADGMDIFKNMETWHSSIGYIPQTIYLSDDTIRHNVAFGVKEEAINEEAVMSALEKAHLSDFLEGLSDGIETIVGDRGVRLSGGQRQRIGIARALYHNPDILILDEATSALDNETEMSVMNAIENLRGEKTLIIIAHRLSTIKTADVIYEVEDGKVVERSKKEVFKE